MTCLKQQIEVQLRMGELSKVILDSKLFHSGGNKIYIKADSIFG